MTGEGGCDFAIDLPAGTEWSSIEQVRTSIQKTFASVFPDDGCQTIAMVARELLENAIKYGDSNGPDVRLRIWSAEPHLNVVVENRVKPSDAGAATLLTALTWMNQFETPAKAYRAKLLEARTEGGLGLLRIAYEGNCSLTADIVDSTLRVTARIPVDEMRESSRRLTASGLMGQAERVMEDLLAGDLNIKASQADPAAPIVLDWRGSSTDRNPAKTVNPYVRGVYDIAAARNVPVEMHFEKLDHFNSSTISAMIELIQEARTRQLKLALSYDAAVKWQRLTFEALSVFAKDELLVLRRV